MQILGSMDKRQHPRYKVKERVFVECSAHPVKIGELIDISAGGLSFRYLANGETLKKDFEVTIYFAPGRFKSEEIPLKTVSDFIIVPEFSAGLTEVRRRGACFRQLGEGQKSHIEDFIRNHTLGEA